MARHEELAQPVKPAFSLEDLECRKIAPNPGWLKEIWGKWPGDESIEELLAALKDTNGLVGLYVKTNENEVSNG